MNQEQNNLNSNNFNMQGNNGIPNNQSLQSNQTVEKTKNKKYWLIPVLIFIAMIITKLVQFILLMFEFESDFTNTLFSAMFYICGFAVIPSIILSVVLSNKNK